MLQESIGIRQLHYVLRPEVDTSLGNQISHQKIEPLLWLLQDNHK